MRCMPRVEVLVFRLDWIEGTGSRDTVDDNLMPDFILPNTGSWRDIGSNGIHNGKAVGFEGERA